MRNKDGKGTFFLHTASNVGKERSLPSLPHIYTKQSWQFESHLFQEYWSISNRFPLLVLIYWFYHILFYVFICYYFIYSILINLLHFWSFSDVHITKIFLALL